MKKDKHTDDLPSLKSQIRKLQKKILRWEKMYHKDMVFLNKIITEQRKEIFIFTQTDIDEIRRLNKELKQTNKKNTFLKAEINSIELGMQKLSHRYNNKVKQLQELAFTEPNLFSKTKSSRQEGALLPDENKRKPKPPSPKHRRKTKTARHRQPKRSTNQKLREEVHALNAIIESLRTDPTSEMQALQNKYEATVSELRRTQYDNQCLRQCNALLSNPVYGSTTLLNTRPHPPAAPVSRLSPRSPQSDSPTYRTSGRSARFKESKKHTKIYSPRGAGLFYPVPTGRGRFIAPFGPPQQPQASHSAGRPGG